MRYVVLTAVLLKNQVFWDVTTYWLVNITTVWLCVITDSLWIKPTDALNSNFIGITTLHVLGRKAARNM